MVWKSSTCRLWNCLRWLDKPWIFNLRVNLLSHNTAADLSKESAFQQHSNNRRLTETKWLKLQVWSLCKLIFCVDGKKNISKNLVQCVLQKSFGTEVFVISSKWAQTCKSSSMALWRVTEEGSNWSQLIYAATWNRLPHLPNTCHV